MSLTGVGGWRRWVENGQYCYIADLVLSPPHQLETAASQRTSMSHSIFPRLSRLPAFLLGLALVGHGVVALRAADTAEAVVPPPDAGALLIGSNWWHGGISTKIDDLAKGLHLKVIRIGGTGYDRRLPSRETLLEWVRRIRAMGAEPLLQVSQYAPAEQAAELVRFFNRDPAAGAPIRHWSIGNEPWLQNRKPALSGLAAQIEKYFKPIAVAMKSVDPTIAIYGPDECDFFEDVYGDLFGGAHDIAVQVPGKKYFYCDGITWHRYPQTNGEPGMVEIEDLRMRMDHCQTLVERVNQRHGRTGADALVWGITEFNANSGKLVHSFGNGQLFGAALGYAGHYGARIATSWSLYESAGNRGKTDFGLFDGRNLVPRPSFWHLGFLSEFGARPVALRVSHPSVLGFSARTGNRTQIILMAVGTKAPLSFTLSPEAIGDQQENQVSITIDPGTRIRLQGTLAPTSTQVLSFVDGALAERITYDQVMFQSGQEPNREVITQREGNAP